MQRYTLGLEASDRLKAMPLFEGLSFPQLQMIARLLDGATAEAGEEIITEGTLTFQYVIIEEGTADVIKNGVKIGELGPGDFFGELALLGGGKPRSATVVATSPMRTLVLTSNSMHQIREHMPVIAERIDIKAEERRASDAAAAANAAS